MKIRSASLNAGLLVGTIALAGLPASSPATAFSFPGTITSGGVNWYVSGNINGVVPVQGNPGTGGFGFSDAEFANAAAGLDAYDGGFVMRINGVLFTASATLNGSVLTSGTASYAGLTSQAEFRFDLTRPIVRSLYSFTNPSQAPINAIFRWEVNLGSDAGTVVRATSSGDGAVDASDRWIVTSDSGTGDAVNTLVRYGANAPHAPDSSAYVPGDPARDLLADQYNVTVQPGQIVRLMMFGRLDSIADGLNAGVTAATDDAPTLFTDYTVMRNAGLFDGLPSNFSEIINWAVPVPEPTTLALFSLGVGALVLRQRRQILKP